MNIEGKTDYQLQRMCVASWKRKLKLSIADIKKGKEKTSSENCAFCEAKSCLKCPVMLKTGIDYCGGTPYLKAHHLYTDIENECHRKLKTFHKAVQKEIDFLKALEC